MKRRREKLDKAVEARRAARKFGQAPGSTRVIPDKRKKPQKHRKAPQSEAQEL